eukprot:EC723130.1.p1 GENE.EC723130.1~~EC723130.1.p1  ORF type:complete len:146 (+),score=1.00 EC723130.1:109-546(+)
MSVVVRRHPVSLRHLLTGLISLSNLRRILFSHRTTIVTVRHRNLPATADEKTTTSEGVEEVFPATSRDSAGFALQASVLSGSHCKRCNSAAYTVSETREVRGLITKILNLQTRRFLTVTCDACGFTEFFERYQNPLSNMADLVVR